MPEVAAAAAAPAPAALAPVEAGAAPAWIFKGAKRFLYV